MDNRIKFKDGFKSILGSIGTGGKLDKIIKKAGYEYDAEQEIFYTTMNPWQRKLGYCYLYDEAAPSFNMILDSEPVKFEYAGKRWLIEFWKGQYALSTGCEIGIYNTEKPDFQIPGVFNGTFYHSAADDERLYLSCRLKKKGKTLFHRKDFHWWLTGFVLGLFSEPSDLTMEIAIGFRERAMFRAFLQALIDLGYSDREVKHRDLTVFIHYSKPYSPQPSTRSPLGDWIVQRRNQVLCALFQKMTRSDAEVIDENALEEAIINLGKNKNVFEMYELIKEYLP